MRFNRTRIILLATLIAVWGGCAGEPTIEDIEGWIRAGKLTKVDDYVAAAAHPMETRVAAVEKLIEYGQISGVQSAVGGAEDRDALVQACLETLQNKLRESTELEQQLQAKDAIFILLQFVTDEQQDTALSTIADWAFKGLSEESTQEELTSQIDQLQMGRDLDRMHSYGLAVASYLLSYGIETGRLINYLARDAKTDEQKQMVLRAIRKLCQMDDLVIPWEVMETARTFKIPETVEFFVDLYLNRIQRVLIANATLTFDEAAEAPESENSNEENGNEENGSEENGSEENGSEENGSEENGSEEETPAVAARTTAIVTVPTGATLPALRKYDSVVLDAETGSELVITAVDGARITFSSPAPAEIPSAVTIIRRQEFPAAERSSALGAAQTMLYGSDEDSARITNTTERKAQVVKAVSRLLREGANATDRWDAAELMLHVGGIAELDAVLAGLDVNLSSYARYVSPTEIQLPDLVIVRMCAETIRPQKETARPVLEAWAAKGDAVQRAISILCLKVLAEPASVEKLNDALTDEQSLEAFFFDRQERRRRLQKIQEGSLPELTVGHLAQNAIDGIQHVAEIEKAQAANEMPAEEANLRIEAAISVISFTGDAFKAQVETAYEQKRHDSAPADTEDAPKPDDAEGSPEASEGDTEESSSP